MIRPYRFFALAAALIVSAVLIAPCICAPQTPSRADSFDVLIKGAMVTTARASGRAVSTSAFPVTGLLQRSPTASAGQIRH